jgi:hypothetical protein
MMFAALFFTCSMAFGQTPNPVPDPGPGNGETQPCHTCCDLEAAIEAKQNEYMEIENSIDADLEAISQIRRDIAIIQRSNFSPREKEILISQKLRMIKLYEDAIAFKESRLRDISRDIHKLWDQWFEFGCDEVDC